MSMLRSRVWIALLVLGAALGARAEEPAPASGDFDRAPPRLSFADGEVSFWRSGAEDWSPAQVNTPLAAGDQLYTGDKANLELQIGPRAFVRAAEDTQFGLTNLEPDFLQFRIVTGVASLDLRSVQSGTTVEVDTPHGAFSVEHPGYYRIEVTDENTTFTSRRGGRATVTPANGQSAAVAPSEQVVVTGTDTPQLETYAAPELDDWDRWNYTRTDQLIDAVSSRYVPNGVYGVDDLDHYGDWRVVPTYGAVWVPRVAAGWVPYSTGSWVYDPYFGWTWVDTAPWGWAPFHYGRWVWVGGYWGWAPGPLVARAYYAPALVAFFDGPAFSIGISFGHASLGWVALGWGEPCVPWWGPAAFRGHPHWVGWGGPRIVNNVVIHRTTVINVNEIHGWANASRRGAVVGVPRGDFGHGHVKVQHFDEAKFAKFKPMRGDVDVRPTAASVMPSTQRGQRPPRAAFERTVVATREPKRGPELGLGRTSPPTRNGAAEAPRGKGKAEKGAAAPPSPTARIVTREKARGSEALGNRPPFGRQSSVERETPPKPPSYRDVRERGAATRAAEPGAPARPETGARGRERAAPPPAPRELPGEPANRVFRGRGEAPGRAAPPSPHAAPGGAPHGGGAAPRGGSVPHGGSPRGGSTPRGGGGGGGGGGGSPGGGPRPGGR